MRWQCETVEAASITHLAQTVGVGKRLAEILIKRGLQDPDKAKAFLHPLLSGLEDPFAITQLRAASERLVRAMAGHENVLVFGDYDVDGVTSTTLLVSLLKRFGLDPYYLVPRRLEEGYGLSIGAIDRALKEYAPKLFIAVDCGTNSVEEAAYLRARGIDVIIIDHHTGKNVLPDAILVNPHVHDDTTAPWANLCTVGLVFKLAHGLLKLLRDSGDETAKQVDIKDYLDIVAAGTIADMVPLREENRILAKAGLERLQNTRRLGLGALFEASGMHLGDPVRPYDISFRLGPRINASGRLADAKLPIQMLLSHDAKFCREAALQLDQYNRERQEIEKSIYEEAARQMDPRRVAHVLYDEKWHSGVVGVVASRLTHEFYQPFLVLGGENGLAKGSGRGVEGLDMVAVLGACKELLTSWGGHPMAVGVSLEPGKMEAFREAFDQAVRKRMGERPLERILKVSTELRPEEVTQALLEELDILHPFGIENPVPIFVVRSIKLAAPVEVFGGKHFRFQLILGGHPVWGVAWNKAERLPPENRPIDIAFELGWNLWKGRRYLQTTLLDWKEA
jgi:single-stranded-DNA-specific exonuclease